MKFLFKNNMRCLLKLSTLSVVAFFAVASTPASSATDQINNQSNQTNNPSNYSSRNSLADNTDTNLRGNPAYSGMSDSNSMDNSGRVKADNTAVNVRDRGQNTVTPLDQGNSREDTEATAAIRKDIMAREGMSIDAQNVKIITQNGKITLRGTVKTEDEKQFISETARGRFGPQSVDDQLEIAGTSERN